MDPVSSSTPQIFKESSLQYCLKNNIKTCSIVDHVVRGECDNFGEARATLTDLYSNLIRVVDFRVRLLEISF